MSVNNDTNKKLVDCRPGQQRTSSGQLDYLNGTDDYPTTCRICGIRLDTFREDSNKNTCEYVACISNNLKMEVK
jgi:hypothetical protein